MLLTHSCRGTDGGAITVTPNDGSTAFAAVTINAECSATYETTDPGWAPSTINFSTGATGANRTYARFDITATGELVVDIVWYLATLPASSQNIVALLGTGSIRQVALNVGSTGYLLLQDTTAGSANATGQVSAGTWYRSQITMSRTGNSLSQKTYIGNSATHEPTLSASWTAAPTFNSDIVMMIIGKYSTASAPNWTVRYNRFAARLGSLDPIPPMLSTITRPCALQANAGSYGVTGPSIPEALEDTTTATYISSTDDPQNKTVRVRLWGMESGPALPRVVTTALATQVSPVITLTTRLIQGSTTIATWTDTLTTSETQYTHTLTAPQLANITDFRDLYLEYEMDVP
jgi:hypothetical protein